MCMSIFTTLANADKSKKPEPRKGFSKLTVSEAERAFSGNMCRCTDVDLEDLGLNIFWKKGDKDADVCKLPAYTLGGGVCTFPDFLKSEIKASLIHLTDVSDVTVSGVGWYHPKSIGQYYDLLNSGIFSDCTVKVVVGNTSSDHAIRATKVEQHLNGKVLTPSVVLEAVQQLRETIVPMEGTSHPEYRVSVAVGFLFSYLSPFGKGIKWPGKTLNISSAGSLDTDDMCNLPLSSRRETVSSEEYKPVGEPIKKYAVELQASGMWLSHRLKSREKRFRGGLSQQL
uniref:Putative aldehyde oxidase 4 n=1 Tax=Aegilops tauschii TaxID=37682 RepID=N1QSH0_AEGTA